MTFDVVIVGGRCAGSPLAIRLARAGLRVCVLDKARFPSDTASTHIIQPRGTAALQRLGVLPDLRAAGAVDITGITLQYADARLDAAYADPAAPAVLSTGTTPGLSLGRRALDGTLLAAAGAAGATVRSPTTVTGLRHERGRVTGVRTSHGDVAARLVVGADGRASSVARLVGAGEYAAYRAPRMAAWSYFTGTRPHGNRLRIGRVGRTALIATPAEDDRLLVGVVPDIAERDAFLADRDASFARQLRDWPELDAIVDGADRIGPMRVVPDWRAHVRVSAGPGWVLTGDAGNFKDPSAAQGISDALVQAETLADAVLAGLDDAGDIDTATRSFWRWRDADCRTMHWFARDMGAAGPTTPLMTEVVRDVAARDPLLLAAVLNRDLPPSAVITPARVARATARTVVRRPLALPALGREVWGAAATLGRRTAGSARGRRLQHA